MKETTRDNVLLGAKVARTVVNTVAIGETWKQVDKYTSNPAVKAGAALGIVVAGGVIQLVTGSLVDKVAGRFNKTEEEKVEDAA